MLRLVLICLLMCSGVAHARWATFADASTEIVDSKMHIDVKADGSFIMDVTKQVKILNERGRESNAKIALTYNYDNSKLEILEAKTINGDQQYALTANLIEDKPLASEIQGFDQTHQVLLAFPNVKVGSTIFVRYRLSMQKPDIQGFFEYMQQYVEQYILQSDMQIDSEMPLFINSNDPNHFLQIDKSTKGQIYSLKVKLLKPIYIDIVDEKPVSINPKKYPWVFVATSDNWSSFAQKNADPYMKVLQQPLPAIYQAIVDDAKQIKDPYKQIEFVASRLNESIQYMGDWKTTNGRHIPQDLNVVANKRLGDCKDFATGMAAILKQLGFKVDLALVQRGQGVYDTDMIKLPGAFHYNHVIVRVMLNNKVLWVDPTNFFSIAAKVLPDISDRQAVVLSVTDSHLEHIPQSLSQDDTIIVKRVLDFSNPEVATVKANLTLQGLAAVSMTGIGLQVSQDTIDNAIIYQLGNYDNIIDKKVLSPKLDSRIVSDLTFDVTYKEKNMLINSNAGKAYIVRNPLVDHFLFNPEQASDVYLGAPKVMHSTITLTNIQVTETDVLDYTLQSPWVDFIRNVKYKKDSVVIEQKIIIKSSWLYNDIIHSPQYQNFAAELAKHFKDGVVIVFDNSAHG